MGIKVLFGLGFGAVPTGTQGSQLAVLMGPHRCSCVQSKVPKTKGSKVTGAECRRMRTGCRWESCPKYLYVITRDPDYKKCVATCDTR